MRSLLTLPEASHYEVYISQDGQDGATHEEAQRWAAAHPTLVRMWQKLRPEPGSGSPVPVWGHVAQHYKWVLDRLFEERGHSHVVLVEDDMELSFDFLRLFAQTAWLLERDPSLLCVSSWNDNSRATLGTDPALFFRTSYFPGLGWMLRRETYLEVLQRGWPTHSHWDNWLRANILGMDCVSPSLPRNRNFGNIGSSMNTIAFSKDIAVVQFYDKKQQVDFGDLSYLLKANYTAHMKRLLSRALRLDEPQLRPRDAPPGMVFLLLYSDSASFARLASFFKIWGHPRSHFQYLQVLEYERDIYLIADVRFCPLLPDYLRVRPSPQVVVQVAQQGEDCNAACASKELLCSNGDMPWLNTCTALQQHFPCERGCILETGGDIPSYVSADLPTKGFCVTKMHNELILCTGMHLGTTRICACVPGPWGESQNVKIAIK
jgi:alpha-1,3-mannosyl-glycoprotein beta-1,2-N-acetylglucosaminyltransferase